MRTQLRVGTVPYLVARPLDEGLGDEPGIELVREVPARLVERLRAGVLDVARVSSIELFRRPGYRRIDGLGVCGRGPVASVQVFLRKAWSEVRSVALDPASRAAATLVRVLAAERPGGPPSFVDVEAPSADPRAAEADAWLRIGDAALREALASDAPPVFNPSLEWTRATGLPFVFATWIVRQDAPIEEHLAAFGRSRERGEARREALCAEAARAWSLPLDACRAYLLDECIYELGPELERTLLAFRDRAARLDLCDAALRPEPIPLPAPR